MFKSHSSKMNFKECSHGSSKRHGFPPRQYLESYVKTNVDVHARKNLYFVTVKEWMPKRPDAAPIDCLILIILKKAT